MNEGRGGEKNEKYASTDDKNLRKTVERKWAPDLPRVKREKRKEGANTKMGESTL